MTPIELQSIIAQGETLTVEFKGEGSSPLSDRELVDAAICLANRQVPEEAWLLVGVDDDGTLTGSIPRHGEETDANRVSALVRSRTTPPLSCISELIDLGNMRILCIGVPKSETPVGTTDGRYLKRVIGADGRPACEPLAFAEMQSKVQAIGASDFSRTVVPELGLSDLDPLELDRLRRIINESGAAADSVLASLDDTLLLKALNVVTGTDAPYGITVAAILLFGKEATIQSTVPTHEAAFQILSDTDVKVNHFTRQPLLRVMEDFVLRFNASNSEQELLVGAQRIGIPDVPERAFREALANALIHRDYTRLGAVHVIWRDEELEVNNPGGFPEGVHLDNLLVTPPTPRNPLLADVFKRAGLVERTGRGIDTIYEQQLKSGRPAPSYERSTNTSVLVSLPCGAANLEFVRLIVEESQAGKRLTVASMILLNGLWLERRLDINSASRLIQMPPHEVRGFLERLVEAGLVDAADEHGSREYFLSAATYRRLGEEAAYVRQVGFDLVRQKQMIVQYVEAHGQISRGQITKLCGVDSESARKLLQGLVKENKLELRGQKRGAHYVLRP